MGTKNPKVSAYVPQALKQRLNAFRNKDKPNAIPESQAVIIILAEYFQMPEVLGQSPEGSQVGGVTLARMEALEQEFSGFTKSVEQRLQELAESIKKLSEPRVDQSKPKEEVIDIQQAISQPSELLPSGKPIQLELHQVEELSDSSLLTELPTKVEEVEEKNELAISLQSEPASELQEEIKPIPGTKLSEIRFGRGKDTLSGVKRKMTLERFTEWTREQDPDKIAWKYVDSPTKGYIPADELPSELKRKLLTWIKENIN
jgi:hypothetical protein